MWPQPRWELTQVNSWKAHGSILDLWKPKETEVGLKSRILSPSSKQKKIREPDTFVSSVAYQNRWQNSNWVQKVTQTEEVAELSVTSALNEKKILCHYKQTKYIISESLLMRHGKLHSFAYMILYVCLKINRIFLIQGLAWKYLGEYQ